MEIHNIIDDILTEFDIPFYDGMPLSDDEPPIYIVYSMYDRCGLYADGKPLQTEYIITFNVIGNDLRKVDEIQSKLSDTLIENEFCYAGCSYQIDNEFPRRFRRIIDFKYYL